MGVYLSLKIWSKTIWQTVNIWFAISYFNLRSERGIGYKTQHEDTCSLSKPCSYSSKVTEKVESKLHEYIYTPIRKIEDF